MTETQERKMKTKLYILDKDGVEQEISTTCAVAELKPKKTPATEKNERLRGWRLDGWKVKDTGNQPPRL